MIKIKYNHWLPRLLKVDAITLYPYVLFAYPSMYIPIVLFKHECIHLEQIERVGVFKFYLSYLYYFCRNGFKYREIPWEVEAYARQTENIEIDEIYFKSKD